jgi:hypothetical protein
MPRNGSMVGAVRGCLGEDRVLNQKNQPWASAIPLQTRAVGLPNGRAEHLLWFDLGGANDLSPLVGFIRNQLGEICA